MTSESQLDYQHFMKSLGSRIKEFRKQQGLSLRDMVVKHDYHDSQWRRFERSGVGNLNSLLRVARALNTSVSILLDGLGEYPSGALTRTTKKSSLVENATAQSRGTVQEGEGHSKERRSGVDRRKNADRRSS